MQYNYLTEKTCSQLITFDLEDDKVTNVKFMGGCAGNLTAIPILIDGWTVDQIESKLKGIQCGRRGTSCSDQLALAVRAAYNGELEPADDED